ncbi:c-type cytochrome [Sulfurovum sp. XGS-02]|uniref:Spy/CpxP family protein refolding chaperone n=1 Tax=Sulfurovum sp. XGS-02 TaxID=2925411 RepID=UPI00204A43F5|nr:c-type cytochrome [Sulfurovum sp. XGS-02]UPT77190.1 c-type cytochrome [Sulfurovum sp. XGS-02]
MLKINVIVATAIIGVSTLYAGDVDLVKTKCATCHMLEKPTPDMIPTLKAPPMGAVMYHTKLVMADKQAMKDFITDYVINPAAKKSVCESNKVQQYGVMPSLKGSITQEELSKIADYLIEHYPSEEFVDMIDEIQRNDKMNALQNSPFLINKEALPHMTKLLIKHWDKQALGLSDEQKKKLLVIRDHTIGEVQKAKRKIDTLETEMMEALFMDDESPKNLESKIDEIAKLKASVTKVHIQCISQTLEILDDEQIEYLLPFWEYK